MGYIKTATHDDIRHGTVTLFAALNYLEGKIVSMLAEKHRHQEWLKFLKRIERETPAGVELHLIADNLRNAQACRYPPQDSPCQVSTDCIAI